LYGLGFGLVEVLVVGGVSGAIAERSLGRLELISILQGLFNLFAFGLFGLLGYYAGGMWRGVVAAVVASGGRLLATLFPIGIYGLGFVREESRREIFYVLMLMAVILGLLGGAAGQIDRRTARSRRLGAKDPAALLSEVVRLERRLRAGQTGACVMAVDVARSTMIKEGADPLAVEFSFREYQEMVARVALENGGEVFSTAGDGALASFLEPANALRAARQVQTDIHSFNEKVNRLAHPFRVRIGLHAGETQAEFSEAPFNELIDVAAHIEAASPIGGIACTEAFRRLLPEEEMAEIARSVDGHSVWIVLTPFLAYD
jgi:class 3 adenylate cyclase